MAEVTTVMQKGFKEPESDPLPVDWGVVQISDVAKITGGGTPSTKKPHFWNGAIPFLTPSDVTSHRTLHISRSSRYITEEGLKQSSAKLMPPGSVLMTSRATIGEVAICDVPMATNQGFINIIVRPDELANEFLAYWITWRKEFLKELGTGTTFKEVSKGVFKTVRIPLPPLPEQRRIAHVLSAIQRAIAAQDDLIAAAREVKRSLMQRLFTHGPGAEPAPTKETEIGEMPEDWEVVEVGKTGEVITGTTPSTKVPEYYNGSYMFISPGDIGETKYAKQTVKYLSEEGLVVSRALPKDTVLVVCIGATIGKTAVTFADQSATNQQINAIIPNERVFSHYLYYALSYRSPSLPSLASGAAVPIVNKSNFSKFLVAIPPLPQQETIAQTLSAADSKIEAEEQRKTALQALFKSMLHQLMTGQVRPKEKL